MDRRFVYHIAELDAGQTVAQFLKQRGFSARLLAALKAYPDGIMADGCAVFVNHVLQKGETLSVFLRETAQEEKILPVPLPLDILYEDEDLIIINKPCGMPVHPSAGNYENTLANGLMDYFQGQAGGFVFRAVTRLDRDTTGVCLVAKNRYAGACLSKAMRQGEIEKVYLAAVDGKPPRAGSIRAPIGRALDSILRRQVDFAEGEDAETAFWRIYEKNGVSLVKAVPKTGRTHQIRVHMQYCGAPILGDFLYHPHYEKISRQALHAYSVSFRHPATGEEIRAIAPLTEDIKSIFI